MAEVTVTVSGEVGCGKSAVLQEIEIALKAVGLQVRYADPDAAQADKAGCDLTGELEMYKPEIILVEEIRSKV